MTEDLKEEILKEMSIGMFGALAQETPAPYVAEVDEDYNEVEGDPPDGETASGDINRKEFAKNRIYVDSPEEVPEGFEVQEGSQGGIYYETDEAEQEFTQEEWEEAGLQILEDFDEDDYEWDYWTDSAPEPEEIEPGSIVHISDDMWVAGGETDGPMGVVVDADPEAGEFAVVTEDGDMKLVEDFSSLLSGEADMGITSAWDAPDQDNIRVGWDDEAAEEEEEPEEEEPEEEQPEWAENRNVDFEDIEEGDTIVVRDTETGDVSTIEITHRGDGFVEGRSHRGTAAGVRESELQGDVVDDPDKEILGRVDNPSVHSPVEREQIQETLSQYEEEIEAITDEFPYNVHDGEGVEEVPEVQSGGDFKRLDEETAGRIRGAIVEQVGDKEAVNSVWNAMQSMKQDSSMSAGAYTDALAKETFGLDGDTRPSDDEITISDEEKKAYALYTAASQEAMRKMQGSEFTTHRGLREHGAKSLVKGWLEDPMATDYRVEENASANHTVTEGIAKSFGDSQLRISQESTPEDILNANDLIRGNYKASPGAHEGEVWRPGGEQAVNAWEITLGSFIEGEGAFGETKELTLGDYQKPIDELDEPMLQNMGKHVQKLDEEDALNGEAADNLRAFAERYEEVMGDDKMHEVADRAIADSKIDESPVIDLTHPEEADWLGEGREESEERDEKSDIAAALINTTATFLKGRRYIDDPSEAPDDVDVQEGPQGGLYYETEGGTSEGDTTPDTSFGGVDFSESNEYGVLPESEQVKLRDHLAEQHGEDVVEDFYGDYGWMNEWKAHRESDEGVKMGIAYARALGLDESNVKSYEESLAEEVTEDHVALAEDLHQASKTWCREKFGDEAQMNRGFKDGGPKMLGTLFADEESSISLSGNEMDNWAWNMDSPMEWGRSRSDGIGAIVRTNRDIDEVIFTIDGIAGEYPTHNDNAVTFDGDAEVEKENVSLESRGAVKEYEEDGSWDYNWDSYEGSFFPFRPLEEQDMEGIKAFALSASDELKFASLPNEEAEARAKELLERVDEYLQDNLDPEDPSDEQILEEFDPENVTRYW